MNVIVEQQKSSQAAKINTNQYHPGNQLLDRFPKVALGNFI